MNFLRSFFIAIFLIAASFSAAEDIAVPTDTKIILQRTACYGACPVYTLAIFADGKVEFNGVKNVVAKGLNVKTISPEKVKLMLAEAQRINFFDLNDEDYNCEDIHDVASVNITITKDGQTKEIHDRGCMKTDQAKGQALAEFENSIDELAEIADWKNDDGSFDRYLKENRKHTEKYLGK